jgi:hypothetical protein
MAAAVAPPSRLGTSQSAGNLSQLGDKRRERLMDLKKREDLKGALTEKLKARFGRGSTQRADDEVSVASTTIRGEVNKFASVAHISEANLGRLERRLQAKATRKAADEETVVTGVSAYSGASQRSRSAASLHGMNIVKSGGATQDRAYKDFANFDWNQLDEYAAYLHEQDALRQKMGVQALQKKLRSDLDDQVEEKRRRREHDEEEDKRYHQFSMVELEKWKQMERQREEERHQKLMKEKADRDEQMSFNMSLRAEEAAKNKQEESALVEKIVTEMETEQRRFERKKEAAKKSMKKVFQENMEDQKKRDEQRRIMQAREAQQMQEYNRILDEQEEQRAGELAARIEKQNQLMGQLMANVGDMQKGASNNDAQRAQAQQDEMDRHYFEAESMKQARLKQLRLENAAYLQKQMQEKSGRKDDDKQLQMIQAQILRSDTDEYNEIERKKEEMKRIMAEEHRQEVERQIEYKRAQKPTTMSMHEINMNKPLLSLVTRTLQSKDDLPPLEELPGED